MSYYFSDYCEEAEYVVGECIRNTSFDDLDSIYEMRVRVIDLVTSEHFKHNTNIEAVERLGRVICDPAEREKLRPFDLDDFESPRHLERFVMRCAIEKVFDSVLISCLKGARND